MLNIERVNRSIEAGVKSAKTSEGRSRIECIRLCSEGYAEPGYSDPESGVIAFGNWNDITRWDAAKHEFVTIGDTPSRIAALLEKLGVELEWADEWACCAQCSKAVRTGPDSYNWKPSFWQDDSGSITCCGCISEDPTDYLMSLEGNTRKCVTLDIDLAEQGYVLLEDGFENGFHYGQDADPKLIGKLLREQGIERFLFNLDHTGQFDLGFSVWVHEDEFAEVDHEAWLDAEKDGPSVAGGLQRALQDATRKMSDQPDAGIKVAKCDVGTGTAQVRTVTPQEFLDGRALDF
jgi:hypothetical protein